MSQSSQLENKLNYVCSAKCYRKEPEGFSFGSEEDPGGRGAINIQTVLTEKKEECYAMGQLCK